MGRVKTEKKKPFIDMTAMSDVTVLLLTFFMLTSTFLNKEPVTVITPASVAEEKVPEQNLLTVLVNPEGKVFFAISGDRDSTYSSEKMREAILTNAVETYNKSHSQKIQLTKENVKTFGSTYMYGLPFAKLKEWLEMPLDQRDKYLDPSKPEGAGAGIPIDMNKDLEKPNEFQIWMRAAYNTDNENFKKAVKTGLGVAIKADASTPYEVIEVVMDNLQTLKMNKFSLMTALKTEED